MRILEQLKTLDRLAVDLSQAIANEHYHKARRLLRRLDSIDLELQVQSVRVPFLSQLLIKEKCYDTARSLLFTHLIYNWGCSKTLALIRSLNPVVSESSCLYTFEVFNNGLSFGLFTYFSGLQVIDLDIVADSHDQAIKYLDDIFIFNDLNNYESARCINIASLPNTCSNQGIWQLGPLRSADCVTDEL